jgi:hypothetical protein
MATTAARDERLTPQAKALLVVLHARAGLERQTMTTKGTLASVMGRCVRSIQRYIAELVRFGYITAETRAGRSGLHVGLLIRVQEKARPFFDDVAACGRWLARKFGSDLPVSDLWSGNGGFRGETKLSPKNPAHFNNRGEMRVSTPHPA